MSNPEAGPKGGGGSETEGFKKEIEILNPFALFGQLAKKVINSEGVRKFIEGLTGFLFGGGGGGAKHESHGAPKKAH